MREVRSLLALCVSVFVLTLGTAAYAQDDDDDLLGDMGGGDTATTEPADTPDDSGGSIGELDDDDDLTQSLDEIDAAPADSATPEESEASEDESADEEEEDTEGDPASLDKVKAVPRKPMLKKLRLEITPFVGLSLNDAFFRHMTIGGTVVFYPHDNFGIGLGANYWLFSEETDNIRFVREGLTSVPAVFEQPELMAHLDFYWIPVYGKLSLFDSSIIHFDFYANAGIGFVTGVGGRTPAMVNVGIGQRFKIADWLALRFEVRDYIYVDRQFVNNQPRSDIQNFVMFQLGLSIFIPPSFEYKLL